MDFLISEVNFLVEDLERSIAFYKYKVGLKLKQQNKWFAEFETGEATFTVRQAEKFQKTIGVEHVSNCGHRCIAAFQFEDGDEVNQYYRQLKDNGVEFVTDMVDWPWGARAAYFKDPDGFLWEIYAWVGKPYTW